MGISKVIYGDRTLIDLTADTVTADKLLLGFTAHNAAGNLITGTASGEPYAMILVQHPENTICTCPTASMSFAFDTFSTLFYVNGNGTYTITSVNGELTRTNSVVISSQYQKAYVNVTFTYSFPIQDAFWAKTNSNAYLSVSGGAYVQFHTRSAYVYRVYMVNPVDLTPFSKLTFNITYRTEDTTYIGFANATPVDGIVWQASVVTGRTAPKTELDVSSLSGNHWLMLANNSSTTSYCPRLNSAVLS